MKKTIYLTSLFLVFTVLISMNKPMLNKGHIYKVVVNVEEHLMENALEKEDNGSIAYDKKNRLKFVGETDYEMLSKEQVNLLLTDFCEILGSKTTVDEVSTERAKASAAGMMGNIGANATGKSRIGMFPEKKLKKIKVDANEFYAIKIDFLYGGGKTDNKKKTGVLKLKLKVSVTASDAKGDVLWEKENEVKNLSSVFNNSSLSYNSGDKYFSVSREPRIFNEYTNEPIGDFNSLSLQEVGECVKLALNEVL